MIFSPRFLNPFPIFPAIDPIVIPEQPSPFLDSVTTHSLVLQSYVDAFVTEEPVFGISHKPAITQVIEQEQKGDPFFVFADDFYPVYEVHRPATAFIESIDSPAIRAVVKGLKIIFQTNEDYYRFDCDDDTPIDCDDESQDWKLSFEDTFFVIDDDVSLKISELDSDDKIELAKIVFSHLLLPTMGYFHVEGEIEDYPDPIHRVCLAYVAQFLNALVNDLSSDQRNQVFQFWMRELWQEKESKNILLFNAGDDFFINYFFNRIQLFDEKTVLEFLNFFTCFNANLFLIVHGEHYFKMAEANRDILVRRKISNLFEAIQKLSDKNKHYQDLLANVLMITASGGERFTRFVGLLLEELEKVGFSVTEYAEEMKTLLLQKHASLRHRPPHILQIPAALRLWEAYPVLRLVYPQHNVVLRKEAEC